jgi:hypothetical protein
VGGDSHYVLILCAIGIRSTTDTGTRYRLNHSVSIPFRPRDAREISLLENSSGDGDVREA